MYEINRNLHVDLLFCVLRKSIQRILEYKNRETSIENKVARKMTFK